MTSKETSSLGLIEREIFNLADDADGTACMDAINNFVASLATTGAEELKRDEKTQTSNGIEELKLRPYQEELCEYVCSLSRPNTLVTCETNSGKTFVAMSAILHWMKNNPKENGKFAFVTHRVALCEQQYRSMCRFVPSDMITICHGETPTDVNVFFGEDCTKTITQKVFLFTAQTFLNLIEKNKLSLIDFTLIVFDECHHIDLKHPYNEIMLNYLYLKYEDSTVSDSQLPQILGLTASPTVFQQVIDTEESAEKCIKQLIYNMDAKYVSIVEKQKADLVAHCRAPEEKIELIEMDSEDSLFEYTLQSLIKKLIGNLSNALATFNNEMSGSNSLFLSDNLAKVPSNFKSQNFETWAREMSNIDTGHQKLQICLSLSTKLCIHLCIILRLAASVDNLILLQNIREFVDRELTPSQESILKPNIQALYTLYYQSCNSFDQKLEEDALEGRDSHKMCNTLREIICRDLVEDDINSLQGGEESVPVPKTNKKRGIVFVQTKLECIMLKKWALGEERCKSLSADFITADVKNQVDVLHNFANGNCRLLFATSVIEEGIDIPDCKLVVNYNNRINHIQQLQQRGRARMNGALYYVISCNPQYHESALCNAKRQRLTEYALAKIICRMRDQNGGIGMASAAAQFNADMIGFQKEALKVFLLSKELQKTPALNKHLFLFKCRHCTKQVFSSEEVFCFKENFRIVLTTGSETKFRYKFHTLDAKTEKYFRSVGLECCTALFCFHCKNRLGSLIKYGFWGLINPILESYIISHEATNCEFCTAQKDPFTVGFETKPYKKWKQVPFGQPVMKALELKRNLLTLSQLAKGDDGGGHFQKMFDAESL